MKKIKYIILLVILFIAIGFATISYTLNLKGNADLAGDLDNFNVYYSNTYVNGVEDYSVITSPTELDFTTTIKEPGTTYSITYDVTNGSKHFDAQLTMTCTSGDTYMSVVNNFDTSTNLEALGTRSGTITIKKLKSIASNEITAKTVSCTITATPVERTTLGEGTAIDKQYAVLKATTETDTTMFRAPEYKEKIKTITFQDTINIPEEAIESWDIGVAGNGNIMAYLVTNADDDTMYDLYIQANGKIYGNRNMSYWFANFTNLDAINNLSLLDTSSVVNMMAMFYQTGRYSTSFSLGEVPFNTSNVINMEEMFYAAGHDSAEYLINVSSFDTSNVTNMSRMFMYNGYSNTNFNIDVSNFNTTRVTNMMYMFCYTGASTKNLELNLNNFDTSNVTNMSGMFEGTGINSESVVVKIDNFNTAKVKSMNFMFSRTAKDASVVKIDISNFDTSNVTNMSYMFQTFGYSSETFSLDVSKFDTRNVIEMKKMFFQTGYNSTTFTLDVSKFDTSNVTSMDNMFSYAGYKSTKLNTTFTFRNSNVINYTDMFLNTALQPGSQITVNYTSETEDLVDAMIATKSEGANVIKGTLVQ